MSSNARYALQWLTQHGYSPQAAAGIVGNLVAESGVNPNGPSGDHGTAHGLAQWRGNRYTNLLNYARSNNADPRGLDTQLGFLDNELRNQYGSVYRQLMAARDPRSAASAFVLGYERPAGAQTGVAENTSGWGVRLRNAMNLANGGSGSFQGPALGAGGEQTASSGGPNPADIEPYYEPDEPDQRESSYASYGVSAPDEYTGPDFNSSPPMAFDMEAPADGSADRVAQRASEGAQRISEVGNMNLADLFADAVGRLDTIGAAGRPSIDQMMGKAKQPGRWGA
jgi:hypothetical protein